MLPKPTGSVSGGSASPKVSWNVAALRQVRPKSSTTASSPTCTAGPVPLVTTLTSVIFGGFELRSLTVGALPNAPDTVTLAVAFDATGTGPDGAAPLLFDFELQPATNTAPAASAAAATAIGRWDIKRINVVLQGRSRVTR